MGLRFTVFIASFDPCFNELLFVSIALAPTATLYFNCSGLLTSHEATIPLGKTKNAPVRQAVLLISP